MRTYSAAEVAARLPYGALIERLREAFRADIETPLRSTYSITSPAGETALFGVMPAWQPGVALVTKLFTLFPGNAARGLPTIHAQIVLFDGRSGIPSAVIDGTEVTRRRTAAASALAATYLAHEQAERLLVLGTGAQAPHQVLAHAVARPIRSIGVWGRDATKARALANTLEAELPGCTLEAVEDLPAAVRAADVISCATSAVQPLVRGEWLKPGVFLDLVGSHTAERRECDDEAVRRSRIFVDTRAGALAEAGDLIIPLQSGALRPADIRGDLAELCRSEVVGRGTDAEITLFKSVGAALEDLAAAQLIAATP
jgi:alanine dehydrogenase